MKTSALLALLFIGGVIYFVTGGGALFGLFRPQHLPDRITPPNTTFLGAEYTNAYVE